jgi:hypothetical protein
MIVGDSLVVMNSLLQYEGMGGKVQIIYMDPPYCVRFGSNFQPFVRKRDVGHGDDEDMTREPEMVQAYRDTWELGSIDNHPATAAFVKNTGLGFSVPYLHNGQMHDYIPDFIVKLKTTPEAHLILETKGFDPLGDVKREAAERWAAAVNADGTYGKWMYAVARKPEEVSKILSTASKL